MFQHVVRVAHVVVVLLLKSIEQNREDFFQHRLYLTSHQQRRTPKANCDNFTLELFVLQVVTNWQIIRLGLKALTP
jgi:hypothetical protein